MSNSRVCLRCGSVHSSDDVRAIGRFSVESMTYVAKHGHLARLTREEAENDECAWRIDESTKSQPKAEIVPMAIQMELPLKVVTEKKPNSAHPFPSITMEVAAREKAWLDFLVQVNMSLMVWKIDHSLRGRIEAPTVWILQRINELRSMLSDQARKVEVNAA